MTTAPVHRSPRLERSRTDKWFGGVCGGLAAHFGWSPALVRTLFVLSVILPGPQVLVYLALWIVIPKAPA
ncbi:PspC domain-containing protein [Williamsia sterculiae]|uniref:Phage shock protein C (PspC) family protein n=1 Tax=Williamsia sterculiae TaxID=1344003 RepID=A0A1N7EPW6_9NOCA|nr:PspC domain-containing protein [Williamsia sterculiae]SIR90147.1 phage shock protein C (PspC) family protein [Williamsia sterculiae]